MKKIAPFLFLVLLSLVACAKAGTPLPSETAGVEATASPTSELAPPPTAIIAPTLALDPTATSDARLPPEQWQSWPVVPAVTGRAIEIYRQGLLLGNDTHAFSKVGDCQSVKAAFMGFYDIPDRYYLGDYQYLQETIDNFRGYFNTDGQAVKGGFNAATVLSPLWANPEVCLAGENPLECELRLTKPVIVFVSFEVWWEGRTAEEYEKYMRQIIDIIITHGAVPILATKADNVEGDHSINLTTVRLAHEYDLPLWNFWLAVQPLPYHGMDPVRDDGFHISTDGWNTRSFTGLQSLDSIWRGLRDYSAAEGAVPTVTPTPIASTGLLPLPEGAARLTDAGEKVVFGTAVRSGALYQPTGVHYYDLLSASTFHLLGPGWDFQAVSPLDGSLLVNQGANLYRTNGLSLTPIATDFYAWGEKGALVLANGDILYIRSRVGGTEIVRTRSDGSGLLRVSRDGDAPVELYPSTDGVHLAWESGLCSSYHICEHQGAWLTNLTSLESRSLIGMGRPLVSPDGTHMAYEFVSGENRTNLAFATADGVPTRTFPLYGDLLVDYAWDGYGEWLAVHLAIRSDYSGRVSNGTNYLVEVDTLSTRQLPSVLLLDPSLVWSPDDDQIAWLGTDWQTDAYQIRFFLLDVASGEVTNLSNQLGLKDSRFICITNDGWLASP